MKVGHCLTVMPHPVGRFNEMNTTGPTIKLIRLKSNLPTETEVFINLVNMWNGREKLVCHAEIYGTPHLTNREKCCQSFSELKKKL